MHTQRTHKGSIYFPLKSKCSPAASRKSQAIQLRGEKCSKGADIVSLRKFFSARAHTGSVKQREKDSPAPPSAGGDRLIDGTEEKSLKAEKKTPTRPHPEEGARLVETLNSDSVYVFVPAQTRRSDPRNRTASDYPIWSWRGMNPLPDSVKCLPFL